MLSHNINNILYIDLPEDCFLKELCTRFLEDLSEKLGTCFIETFRPKNLI